jgi:hypothetical protein
MNEDRYKRDIVAAMEGRGFKMQAHEDMYVKFIPDLSFSAGKTDGWIEVKYAHKLPGTLADIKHYTTGQQEWLITRGKAGAGHCFLWVGSPILHAVWHFSKLRQCRGMPIVGALDLACIVRDSTDEVAARLADVVQRRG